MGGLNYNAFTRSGNEDEIKKIIKDPINTRAKAYEGLIKNCDNYYNQVKPLLSEQNEIIEDFDTKAYIKGSGPRKGDMLTNMESTATAIKALVDAIITVKALFMDAKSFYTGLASKCEAEIQKAHAEIDAEFSKKDEEEPGERESAYKSVIYTIEGETVTHSR